MARFRVRTDQGAVYGSFSDYDLALGQALHLTEHRRQHAQAATIEEADGPTGSWRQVIRLEADGQQEPRLSLALPRRRHRLSGLAT